MAKPRLDEEVRLPYLLGPHHTHHHIIGIRPLPHMEAILVQVRVEPPQNWPLIIDILAAILVKVSALLRTTHTHAAATLRLFPWQPPCMFQRRMDILQTGGLLWLASHE
jgi:hypothetical protein